MTSTRSESARAGAARRRAVWAVALPLVLAVLALSAVRPADAQRPIAGDAVPISLEVSNGELIELDGDASSVFIANPEIADIEVVTPTLIYVFARAPGRTNIIAVNETDSVVGNILLVSRLPMDEVNRSIASVLPGSAIRAEAAGGSVLLTGTAASAVDVANAIQVAQAYVADPALVINQTAVEGPNQINLRVRIAEVSRDVSEELGVNWQGLMVSGDFAFGLLTGRSFLPAINSVGGTALAEGSGLVQSLTGPLVAAPGDTFGSTFLQYDFNDGTGATTLLDLLDQEGLASILAEPNLTTVSGETANFLAGAEFPIPMVDEDGRASIEFRPVGVTLAFTPTLLANNRISMRVRPEVSSVVGQILFNGTNIPNLAVRRAETSVELGSGESLVIAGLFQSDVQRTVTGLPVLMDLPILGPLFRSEQFQNQETELLIFVTPYLVEPVSDQRLVSPLDPPTDLIDTPDYSAASLQPSPLAGPGGGGFQPVGFILK